MMSKFETGQRWINKNDPKFSLLIVGEVNKPKILVYSTAICNTIRIEDFFILEHFQLESK